MAHPEVDINAINKDGYTLLCFAAGNGNIEVANFVIGKGAEVDKVDGCGYTELMMGAVDGHIEIVKVLLDHRNGMGDLIIDINAKDDEYGETALIVAAMRGNLEIVQAILAHDKCDSDIINVKNNFGSTALMMAVSKGDIEIVKELLDHKDGDAYAVGDDDAREATKRVEEENSELAGTIRDYINEREVSSPGRHSYINQEIPGQHKEKLAGKERNGCSTG